MVTRGVGELGVRALIYWIDALFVVVKYMYIQEFM